MAANVTQAQQGAAVPGVVPSKQSKQIINNTYEFDRTTSRTVSEVGDVKRLSVAVFIAQRREGEGENKKYTPRSTEEMSMIENIVKSAVGYSEERNDLVTVAEIPFDTSTTEETIADIANADRWQMILTFGRMGATGGIILVMLLFFRSFLKKAPPEHFPIWLPTADQMALPQPGGAALPEGQGRPGGRALPGNEVKEEVGQLAEKNPEQVAQVVKNWMSQ